MFDLMELVRVSMTVSRIDSHAKIKMKNENDSEFRILFFSSSFFRNTMKNDEFARTTTKREKMMKEI